MRRRRLVVAAAVIAISGLEGRRSREASANAPVGYYSADEAGVIMDTKTGLVWQARAVPPRRTFAEADTYCRTLSIGPRTTGWRLPHIRELLTLLDPSQPEAPTWDRASFGRTGPSQVWSDTPDMESSSGALWNIDVSFTSSGSSEPTAALGVLCVHD